LARTVESPVGATNSDTATTTLATARPSPGARPPAAAPGHGRFPCFDGLRALAAVAILVHHTAYWANGGLSARWGPYYAELTVGVYVFFVISGFLLYQPFAVAHQAEQPAPAPAPYLRRRALRIYPAYWVALIFTMYLLPIEFIEFSSTRETVANFLLVQRYFTWPTVFGAGLPQAWTLVTELSFYLFLPVYAWGVGKLTRRFGLRAELGVLAALIAIGVVVQVFSTFAGPVWPPLNVLPFFFPVFGLGMLLAVASVWVSRLDHVPDVFEWIGRVPWLWWALAGVCFVATVELVGIPARGDYGLDQAYARVWTHTLVGVFLLVPAVFGPQDRGLIRGFLRWKPWAFLGVISYGIYLWHLTVAAMVRDWWWERSHVTLPVWELLIPVFVLTVAVSTVSWYVIERPCIDLSRRRVRRRLDRTPV
jgi:peptidoglycan/LPS O-acetylase OafA/YrhL